MTLIEEFYEENKHKYSDIPLNEFKLICSSPFMLIKEVMNRGILKDIRLKYLGVFKVVPARVKHSLINLESNYKEGKISKDRYEKRKKILGKYDNKD